MAAGFADAVLAAVKVAAGDFASELLEELHAEGRKAVKGLTECVDGELEQGAGALGAEGEGVAAFAEGGAELDEIAGTGGTEGKAGVEAVSPAGEDAGNDDMEALAEVSLAKNDITIADLE